MITLAVSLIVNCSVSFRSIPKILTITLLFAGIREELKIPHFTTVIRWVTRLGYYLLKRSTRKICSAKKPWVCIADHTIQVGTNKAFVVIGIPAKALNSGKALTLKDATVLAAEVKKSWTGENVSKTLKKVFKHNGYPHQIVIDGASNLRKGVREVLGEIGNDCHMTYDITHLIAKLFKKKYNSNAKFQRIMSELAITSKKIAQSDIGYLIPPKIREKSRFLNLPNLANWLDKLIDILKRTTLSGAERKLIKKNFGWIWKPDLEAYIRNFIREVKAIKDLQKILKNTGINEFSYRKACSKLSEIEDNDFTEPIKKALLKELEYARNASFPLLLTSDLIESLFGKYKTIAKPHRLSEINRTVLTIPVVCEELTTNLVDKAFSKTTEKEVSRWIKRNIPQTLLSRKSVVMRDRKDNVFKISELKQTLPGGKSVSIIGQKTAVCF